IEAVRRDIELWRRQGQGSSKPFWETSFLSSSYFILDPRITLQLCCFSACSLLMINICR
uniref:Uncharacterized protein n=1 Tax=Aegilops tauschii subsp. strangulata TaxID=200361 RepID=A0A453JT89_AEGTS